MNIFITGGTGFIGKRVVFDLSNHVNNIYLLVRPISLEKAKRLFGHLKNVHYILGDILNNNLTLRDEDRSLIIENTESILHLAGYYDLRISQLTAYTHNVIGVQNILALACECKKLQIFHHISTYAVSGNLKGLHNENTIANPRYFTDHYARSKMQGEQIFRQVVMPNIKKRIYRPGIVVGSTKSGEIEKIDGPYYLMKFINKHKELLKAINYIKFLPFPYDEKTILPLIPVDILSQWLVEAILHPSAHNDLRSYHFVSNNKIYIKKVIEIIFHLHEIRPQIIQLGKIPGFANFLPIMGIPKELMTYMFQAADFDTKNRQDDFPNLIDFQLSDITKNFVEGAAQYFEQENV